MTDASARTEELGDRVDRLERELASFRKVIKMTAVVLIAGMYDEADADVLLGIIDGRG